MYQLKITRPGSLLSVVLEREIDDRQLSIIRLLLESDMTYSEALAVFGTATFDGPFGDPAIVGENGRPRYGIEQYQAEDR